jgi:RLL motif-containing protein 1
MLASLAFKLEALQYPKRGDAAVASMQTVVSDRQFRVLICWLETTKLRESDDSTPLRQIDDVAAWSASFVRYLTDTMRCPYAFDATDAAADGVTLSVSASSTSSSSSDNASVLDWLLTQAISVEYADHAAEYNAAAVLPAACLNGVDGSVAAVAPLDCSSPEFVTALLSLSRLFGIPDPDLTGDARVLLKVIQSRIEEHFVTPTTTAADDATNDASTKAPQRPHSLGFTTGDALVDKAAVLLRLLFINDLRDLQSVVNEITVLVQEYTANAVCNTKLGKVGVGIGRRK